MGSFDAFFQKWLVYYENVSDCKPLILSGGPMLIHAQPNYVLRCSKLFKFSFGMGLMVGTHGSMYSKLANMKEKWTLIFYKWEKPSKPQFLAFFSLFQAKNFCSDILFYCKFCCRIRIWGQLDSGSTQRCLKIHIFANFSRFNAFLSAKISIFRHSWAFPQSNWPQHLILRQNIQ